MCRSRRSPLASLPSRHRFAPLPAPLTDQPLLPVVALATVLLAHVRSFSRSDEITHLVGKAPGLAPHRARFARLRGELLADAATSPPAGPLFNVTVPGMCCLPQRTNASNTSPRALPFGVSE